MDKKTLLAINGVLLVAVVFLFIKVFTMKPGEVQVTDSGTNTTDGTEVISQVIDAFESDTSERKLASVAFILSDSLATGYHLVAEIEGKLQQKERSMQYTLDQKEQEIQAAAQKLQEDSYSLTEAEYYERQMGLEQLYYDAQAMQYEMEQEYSMYTAELYEDLYNRVTEFLDRYGSLHNYDYVLQVSATTGVLYANEALDITGPVVDGLNAEYDAQNTTE